MTAPLAPGAADPSAPIGLDASFLEAATSGIGEYLRNLAPALRREVVQPLVVFHPRGRAEAWMDGGARRAMPWAEGERYRRVLLSPRVWPAAVRGAGLGLLHVPYSYCPRVPCPVVVTVHDVRFMRLPTSYDPIRYLFLRHTVGSALRRAARVIAVSEFTRGEVVGLFGIPPRKVAVVHNAARAGFAPVPGADGGRLRGELGLPDRYLVAVGRIEPHKNYPFLLRAFAAFRRRTGYPGALLIAGAEGRDFARVAREAERLGTGDIRLLGHVPDESLPALYGLAEAVVCPSLYEGFGIPVVEAMACGVPVLVSDRASLPEVAGEAGLVFDATDEGSLLEGLRRVTTDRDLRQHLADAGPRHAARFSWTAAARETAAVYRLAMQGPADAYGFP
jgi:glycosyltransferase involved in cell wall biosynthesis